MTIPAGETIFKTAEITPTLAAMGRVNPIQVRFEWDGANKRTLAVLDLPRPISVHQLLYGQSPAVEYPVSIYNEPEFLHMWMNHPVNQESNHYYAEFQPWIPIYQKTVRYFSYYIWGAAGDWKPALEELRKRNLITSK